MGSIDDYLSFFVIELLRGLLISEERQGITAYCEDGRLNNKPTLDALTTEGEEITFQTFKVL